MDYIEIKRVNVLMTILVSLVLIGISYIIFFNNSKFWTYLSLLPMLIFLLVILNDDFYYMEKIEVKKTKELKK